MNPTIINVTAVTAATAVLDIGKTNVKLTLLDDNGAVLAERRCPNGIVAAAPYPHHDTERIWNWLLDGLGAMARLARITAIVPVTHGATAALVDADGLVLPVLDYESALPQALDQAYRAVRPAFAETCSPDLPAGLNLGRQLFWLARSFPAEFGRARHILSYPQYWAWRLCGVAAGEVTSLGCHTDLWEPLRQRPSTLVERMGWQDKLPPLRPAWSALGPLNQELRERTGLPADCQVLCGIHDSNASLLRHIGADAPACTVLSTGTWVIAAAPGAPLERLNERADMLANVSALGQPVACMRFMGGREFAELAGADALPCGVAELERLVGRGTMALPCFSASGGPFVGRAGRIIGAAAETPAERYALATLYCVLMSDYCLDALGAAGPVVVEGSFTDNAHFAGLLAALRDGREVSTSDDASGTVCGAWMLRHWGRQPAANGRAATPLALPGWRAYRERWLTLSAA